MSGETLPGWTGAHPPTLSRALGVLGPDPGDPGALLVSRSFDRSSPQVVLTDRASYVAFPEAWLSALVELVRAKPAAETPERPATDPSTVADVVAAITDRPAPERPAEGSVWQRNVPLRCSKHERHVGERTASAGFNNGACWRTGARSAALRALCALAPALGIAWLLVEHRGDPLGALALALWGAWWARVGVREAITAWTWWTMPRRIGALRVRRPGEWKL